MSSKNYCYPKFEILSTYEHGFKKSSKVIKVLNGSLNEPITAANFNSWTGGTDYAYVNVENLVPGDRILGAELTSSTDIAYRILTVHKLNCLYTSKTMVINNNFTFCSDQQILRYDGAVYTYTNAYQFVPGSQMMGEDGNPVLVTSAVFDNCTDYLLFHIEVEQSVNRVVIFNGDSSRLVIASTPRGFN